METARFRRKSAETNIAAKLTTRNEDRRNQKLKGKEMVVCCVE